MQVAGKRMKRHKLVSSQVHIPHTTKGTLGYKPSYEAFVHSVRSLTQAQS